MTASSSAHATRPTQVASKPEPRSNQTISASLTSPAGQAASSKTAGIAPSSPLAARIATPPALARRSVTRRSVDTDQHQAAPVGRLLAGAHTPDAVCTATRPPPPWRARTHRSGPRPPTLSSSQSPRRRSTRRVGHEPPGQRPPRHPDGRHRPTWNQQRGRRRPPRPQHHCGSRRPQQPTTPTPAAANTSAEPVHGPPDVPGHAPARHLAAATVGARCTGPPRSRRRPRRRHRCDAGPSGSLSATADS
jgi:hypothetical protein